jgi:hypothetical protein
MFAETPFSKLNIGRFSTNSNTSGHFFGHFQKLKNSLSKLVDFSPFQNSLFLTVLKFTPSKTPYLTELPILKI